MFSILKFVLFLSSIIGFGFFSLSQIGKIKSLVLLIPLSVSFGVSSYIFLCHVLSFFTGSNKASVLSLILLFLISLLIFTARFKKFIKVELETEKNQLTNLIFTASIIWILSFFSLYRFCCFDKEFHIPLALTLFHNDIYPPRDFFRPDYLLLYHYGGDLLSGAVCKICNFDIFRSYELVLTLFSGTTFLSFFALAWLITKNYKLSFVAGFCTYFGGGFLWLDAILRFLFKKLPQNYLNWGFLETFFNIGIHGGIIDAPSVHAFLSTSGIGYPLLILSLILFWQMVEENDLKTKIIYIVFLNISLFSLFLTAEWLFTTFWAGVILFLLIQILNKNKKVIIPIILLILTSVILNKTIGNALFLQDSTQHLGKANIFDIGLKEKLFTLVSWGRLQSDLKNYQTLSCFSWNFIAEFGLSLLFFPIIIFYLRKTNNTLAILLFLIPLTTMPLPAIIDFKLHSVDLNRLFGFGNTILVLLITCSIGTLYKSFLQKNILIFVYLFIFCLSPISGLISSSIFTPYIYTAKSYAESVIHEFKRIKSFSDLKGYWNGVNNLLLKKRLDPTNDYLKEIRFLKLHSKSQDAAISNLGEIPMYAGVYTFVPSFKFLYKDLLYTNIDTIYSLVLNTLDPYLLDELNIKWILITNNFKNSLPKETQIILNNEKWFKLSYKSVANQEINSNKDLNEIYEVKDIKDFKDKSTRKIGWVLLNKYGQPFEVASLHENKVSLFPSSKKALTYLESLIKLKPKLKNELIVSQPLPINELEKYINTNNLSVTLEKKF